MTDSETAMPDAQTLRAKIVAHDRFNESAKQQNELIGFSCFMGSIIVGGFAMWAAIEYNATINLIVSIFLIFVYALAKSTIFQRVTVMTSTTLWELAELSAQCPEFRTVFLHKFNAKEFLTSDDYRMLMSEKAIIDKRKHENQVLSQIVQADNQRELLK